MIRYRLLASLACLMAAIPLPGLSQDAPANKCKYEQLGSLPLRYHGQGLMVVTDGEIHGTPATFRLNLATGTLLTRYGVERRNLRANWRAGWVSGPGGESRLYGVQVRDLAIGPARTDKRLVLRMIDETSSRLDYDGSAGADVLLQHDLEISLAEKQLRFFQGDKCRDTFLAYWDADAVQVPLEVSRNGGHPTVQVQLDGVTFTALIQPGAGGSSITMPALRKLGLSTASPGMKRSADSDGVGAAQVRTYRYRFNKFAIGRETIEHPELMVIEHATANYDVVLGSDFLRAHRVLLAPSQDKAYFSYLGGAPFSTGGVEDWVVREAEQGNGYAQYRLAALKMRNQEAEEGRAWMDKAVAQSNPSALRQRAGELQRSGKAADAVPLLERAIAQDPFDVMAQLHLFRTRVQAGQAEQANAGLAEAVKRLPDGQWPAPLADYYLGKLTVEKLLEEAASEKELARRRQCQVYGAAGQLLEARGDRAGGAEWRARFESGCRGSLAGAP